MTLQLMTRSDCHLCEEARFLLQEMGLTVGFGNDAAVQLVDIESSLALIQRYGRRVPVLVAEGSREDLGWPFTTKSLGEFLSSNTNEECK